MNPRAFRVLSTILLGVMVAAVGLALTIALSVPARLAETRLEVACASARANILQLEALESIAETLGLPDDTVVIPDLPQECL